jgi:hypothetical protein
MLEDESIIDDEEVFSSIPANTCFVLMHDESTTSKLQTEPMFHLQQRRLTFEGSRLQIRNPSEQVNMFWCKYCFFRLLFIKSIC